VALLLVGLAAPGAPALAQAGSPAAPLASRSTLSIAVDGHNARVLTAREGTVLPARTVFLTGFSAVYLVPTSRFAASFRLRESTRSGDLGYGDLSATYSFGSLAAEVGYGWRRGYELASGLAHAEKHRFARVGGSWRAPLLATPLTLEGRAAFFVPVGGTPDGPNAMIGWDGETTLRVELAPLPMNGIIGFRFERFRVYRTEQEVSMLRLGLSLGSLRVP
jgi:hypothetical protein